MASADLILLIVLIVLIIAAAILGASEAALLRVSRVRLEVAALDGDARSRTMMALLDDLPRVLNTVLLVVLLVQIGAATVAGVFTQRRFGSLGVTIASFVLTFILFVYSEAIPKTFAVKHPETVARWTAPLLRSLVWLLRPVVSLLVAFADLQAPGTGIASPTAPTEEELLRLASHAVATGEIEETDRLLMDRAFELGDQRVDDLYVPRIDITAVSETASIAEALDLALSSGHRRIPVYRSTIDEIIAVASLRDLARIAREDGDVSVMTVAFDPLVVPESKRVIELLEDMRRDDTHFAVVIDEYGGTAGIVTIEDVVLRLVEPIGSLGAPMTTGIERVGSGEWLVSGSVDLDDLEREIGIDLPDGDWNTLAGLIIGHVGRLPAPGETIETAGLHLEVLVTSAHRITDVRVSVVPSSPPSLQDS